MPLEAVIALTDNPVGYAMWLYPLLHYRVDKYEWPVEEITTWRQQIGLQSDNASSVYINSPI
jgi:hypothetical protein